jgi:hypothetical protein
MRRAPDLGPFEAIGANSSSYFKHALAVPPRDGGEVSATPIDRVADCGFLVELLAGGSSGRPCPVR